MSAGQKTGATHLTIWLANLLCSAYGKRVAVLEWNVHGDFVIMEKVCTGKVAGKKPFRVLNVDYYKAAGIKEWELCMQQPYEHILVDYGEADQEILYECGRCEKRILLGSLTEWQQDAYLVQLQKEKERKRGLSFAVTFGSEETRENIERKFQISLKRIPVSVDAFTITRMEWRALKDLF